MSNIFCNAKTCIHNVKKMCNATTIQVHRGGNNKNVFCSSFNNIPLCKTPNASEHMNGCGSNYGYDKHQIGDGLITFLNAEFASEFLVEDGINCTVSDCLFNIGYECASRDVEIKLNRETPDCKTFTKVD